MQSKEFMKWIQDTNEVIKEVNYRVIFLPDDDLMPYEHVSLNTAISNRLMRIQDEDPKEVTLTWTSDEIDMIQMALMIYKTVLLEVHKEEVKKELRSVIESIGKMQKEEEDDKP